MDWQAGQGVSLQNDQKPVWFNREGVWPQKISCMNVTEPSFTKSYRSATATHSKSIYSCLHTVCAKHFSRNWQPLIATYVQCLAKYVCIIHDIIVIVTEQLLHVHSNVSHFSLLHPQMARSMWFSCATLPVWSKDWYPDGYQNPCMFPSNIYIYIYRKYYGSQFD